MRRFPPYSSLLLTVFCLLPLPGQAGTAAVKRLWMDYRENNRFDRLGEYFSGKEVLDGESIVRTDAGQRAGFYWLVRLEFAGEPQTVRAELKVIAPDRPDVLTFAQFEPLTLRAGDQVIHLGLTHDGWRDPNHRPVAWQLRFLDADGREVARESSFLW